MKQNELIITEDESKRISILKALMSILVVFIHSYSEVNYADNISDTYLPLWIETIKYSVSLLIAGSAVPVFFFLASYLLYRKEFNWGKNIKKKARTLLIPYFILNSFWIIVFFIAQHIPILSSFFSRPENNISNWTLSIWISNYFGSPSSRYPMLYPLWFIRDLFVLNLLSIVIEWLTVKFNHIILIFLILTWLFLDSTHLFFLHVQSICFWGLGCYFAKNKIKIAYIDKYKYLLILYPVLIIISSIMRNDVGIVSKMFYRLCLIMGAFFWTWFAGNIKMSIPQNILIYASKYSFCIFLFHEMNLTIIKKVLVKIVPQNSLTVMLLFFGIPIIVVFICLLLSGFLEKHMPRFYRIISGGRVR